MELSYERQFPRSLGHVHQSGEIRIPDINAIRQSTNLYVYCCNNPIMYVDPDGQAFMLVTGAVGAVVGGVAGGIYSYVQHGEVRWQNVVGGAAIGGVIGLTGGVATAYVTAGSITASTGAVIVGTKLMVAGVATTGYASFEAFKKAVGRAGDGKAWHHIVEQTTSNVNKFGAEMIHNARNIVNISHGAGQLHNKISGYYSSVQNFTNGMTVRAWLQTKDFLFQHNFGLETLTKFAKELGATIEFVK